MKDISIVDGYIEHVFNDLPTIKIKITPEIKQSARKIIELASYTTDFYDQLIRTMNLKETYDHKSKAHALNAILSRNGIHYPNSSDKPEDTFRSEQGAILNNMKKDHMSDEGLFIRNLITNTYADMLDVISLLSEDEHDLFHTILRPFRGYASPHDRMHQINVKKARISYWIFPTSI